MKTGSALTPAAYAKELRWKLSLGRGRVEPKEICKALGIRYHEADLGASGTEAGALLRGKTGKVAVVVNEHIRYESRKRFTAGHELGHAFIPHHQQAEFWCVAQDIESYKPTRWVEQEANEFSSELLLPEVIVREQLRRRAPNIALVRELADEYGTSLTATACKVVLLAPDPCAVALSNANGIKWVVSSIATKRQFTFRQGRSPLAATSVAARVFTEAVMRDGLQAVPASAWLSGWRDQAITTIHEEICWFSELGFVLSFVTLPDEE